MAKCDQGYLCEVCGTDVEIITESDLYLRYVMGEISPLKLPHLPERHIICNPTLAQFIIDSDFQPVSCDGPFAKEHLDAAFVSQKEALVTRAWQRLQQIPKLGISLPEYPLPEVLQRWETNKSMESNGQN